MMPTTLNQRINARQALRARGVLPTTALDCTTQKAWATAAGRVSFSNFVYRVTGLSIMKFLGSLNTRPRTSVSDTEYQRRRRALKVFRDSSIVH